MHVYVCTPPTHTHTYTKALLRNYLGLDRIHSSWNACIRYIFLPPCETRNLYIISVLKNKTHHSHGKGLHGYEPHDKTSLKDRTLKLGFCHKWILPGKKKSKTLATWGNFLTYFIRTFLEGRESTYFPLPTYDPAGEKGINK